MASSDAVTDDGARSSSEDDSLRSARPVDRLPEEIIEQILRLTDCNGFASLVLLNRKWRAVSQQADLYVHHLARCPSFAASHPRIPPSSDKNLPRLRSLFAREVKRNLLEPYRRPTQTVVKLVSNSISSSSVPGGEGMQFSTSPKAHYLLAYNSARIYVIDARGPDLEVKRELKILRRPASACINDDSTLLAVLSSEMQVDLYDLEYSPPKRRQSVILDNSPRTIAMSPCGTVLAAAYEGGIEVSSLSPTALPTDRRAVKSDAVDLLAFSFDGTQILGTTVHSSPPSTVILMAPYYDPGSHAHDDKISAMWTTSILFPNTSRDCSHAVLLQDGDHEEADWAFTYDRSFETFRAVRIDDLRSGTTYFTGPVPQGDSQNKLVPSTLASTTYRGELVSAGFHGKEIWVYGVPEDLDAVPDPATAPSHIDGPLSPGLGRHNSDRSSLSRHPSSKNQDSGDRIPQWKLLCDKQRHTFIPGAKMSELDGVSSVKWVSGFGGSSLRERLIVTAPGISSKPRLIIEEDDMDFVDGGRIALVDFDYGVNDGKRTEITIEVGTDEAEVLEEERRDIETEVAIVRRRTVAQKRGQRTTLLRTATTSKPIPLDAPPVPRLDDEDDDPLLPRRIGQIPTSSSAVPANDEEDSEQASIEEQEALDAPYAHASPRSGSTLRRAATAAAVNRIRNPRTADGRPIEYRRADGRAEHPHESDADNWVPPPPPYQEEATGDIPAFLRGPAVQPPPSGSFVGAIHQSHHQSGLPGSDSPHRLHHQRTASDSTTLSRLRPDDIPRPKSSPSVHVDMDNLYDVSPPESPQLMARQPAPPQSSVDGRRMPSGSSTVSTVESSRAGVPQLYAANAGFMQPPPSASSSYDQMLTRPQVPYLNVQTAESPTSASPQDTTPRRLSNAQTWPAAPHLPGAPAAAAMAGYPLTAPPAEVRGGDQFTGFPPAPSASQLDNLHKHMNQGNPRRVSGGMGNKMQLHRVPVGSRADHMHRHASSLPMHPPPPPLTQTDSWQTEPDMPLIISTPKGVSGAFDPPNRRTSDRRGETTILAPIPRHPRPTHVSGPRPTVERLENIYIGQSSSQQSTRQANNLFSKWLSPPSEPSRRTSPSVRRYASRAERSAAKNMKDARQRGWKPQGGGLNNKKKKRRRKAESEIASTAGWTDITTASIWRDKKCAVM